MAPIALLQGFLEKIGIMASTFYISGGFWLPRGTPKIMKIHENLSREPPKRSQMAPRRLLEVHFDQFWALMARVSLRWLLEAYFKVFWALLSRMAFR